MTDWNWPLTTIVVMIGLVLIASIIWDRIRPHNNDEHHHHGTRKS